jgi:hypothetical protein
MTLIQPPVHSEIAPPMIFDNQEPAGTIKVKMGLQGPEVFRFAL